MFKKHMRPLQPHSKKGSLHIRGNKDYRQAPLADNSDQGGADRFPPMPGSAPTPAPNDDSGGPGDGDWGGNVMG